MNLADDLTDAELSFARVACEQRNRDLDTLGVHERVGLMRDGLLNNAGFVVSGAVSVVLVPLMLKGLGPELYGIWALTLAVAGWAASVLDVGLFWTIARQVASRGRSPGHKESLRFIRAGGAVFLLTGAVGAMAIAALGVPITAGMSLSPVSQNVARVVFVLAGVTFFAGQVSTYSKSVLYGQRRFDLSSGISSGLAVLWGAGAIIALRANAGLSAIVTWQAASSGIAALAGLLIVSRLDPSFMPHLRSFDWRSIKDHIGFSLSSQLLTLLSSLVWGAGPLLIGTILGATDVTAYYIGCKGPIAISWLSWNAAEVLFPAATGSTRPQSARDKDLLELGTRWNLVLTLPWCIALWSIAPGLLHAWIGKTDGDTVSITRLMTAAMLADSIAVPSLYVLWGKGATANLLCVLATTAIVEIGLTILLLPRLGVTGAGWAAVAALGFEALALVQMAARACGSSGFSVLLAAARALLVPALSCAGVASLLANLIAPERLISVAVAAFLIGFMYYGTILIFGSRDEEIVFMRAVYGFGAKVFDKLYAEFRRAFEWI